MPQEFLAQHSAGPKRGRKKDSISCENDDAIHQIVKSLLDEMEDALTKDRASNLEKRPAIKRLMLLSKIDATLRRESVHEIFINQSGLIQLYNWLVAMPDGTHPNTKIVLCILQQLDRLELKREDVAELDDLENALNMYSAGIEGSSGYNECAELARAIKNKWNRIKYNITTRYDEAGEFDQGWQTLKRQLDDVKDKADAKRQRLDSDGEEESKRVPNAPETLGAFMSENERSKHTNFVNRPDPDAGVDAEASVRGGGRSGGKDEQSTWSRLKKTMLKLKKGKGLAKPKMPMML